MTKLTMTFLIQTLIATHKFKNVEKNKMQGLNQSTIQKTNQEPGKSY